MKIMASRRFRRRHLTQENLIVLAEPTKMGFK